MTKPATTISIKKYREVEELNKVLIKRDTKFRESFRRFNDVSAWPGNTPSLAEISAGVAKIERELSIATETLDQNTKRLREEAEPYATISRSPEFTEALRVLTDKIAELSTDKLGLQVQQRELLHSFATFGAAVKGAMG